jgi:hydroxymethylpyrimidine/phosphomethylpyrimidine kinase
MSTKDKPKGRVLIIAGSDSGGGAGIQGDVKTVTALGGYAAAAITAVTAQNTKGVFGIHEVPEDFIAHQIKLVLDDIGADAIKTGMLSKASVIDTVADALSAHAKIPLVLDPVMVAKGGAVLLQEKALETLKKRLIPMARIITPNIPEAELLTGKKIHNEADMQSVGELILKMGAHAVLMKGGHLNGEKITDILVEQHGQAVFTSTRINSRNTHGTGCTLASAIAVSLAQGMEMEDSVRRARLYVQEAIRRAPGFGEGHGPLGHSYGIKDIPKPAAGA